MNNIPPFEGDPSAHQDKEDCGEGDDAKASYLEQEDGDHLAQCGQILPCIDHDKPCDADTRGGGKKCIYKTEMSLSG